MKTIIFTILIALFSSTTMSAQIGIGTTSPNAILDIRSSSQASPNNNDGLLVPKVDEFPAANPTAAQDGMMVFVTGNGTPTKGFYYWDEVQTSWVSATGAKRINDLVDGKSDNDGTDDGSSIFLGVDAGLNDNELANYNVGIGYWSLVNNLIGKINTAVGTASLYSNVDGNGNSGFGYSVLQSNIDGEYNTAIGATSLLRTSGNYNTALGTASLQFNETGNGNIAIGYFSGSSSSTNLNDNITIGNSAGWFETDSNRLYIENSNADADNALLYGEFDNNVLRTNSQFQIGNPTLTGFAFPTVDGFLNQILQTDGSGNLNWADPSNIVLHSVNDLIDGKSDSDGTEDGSSIFLGIGAGSNDDGNDNANVGVGYQTLFSNTTGRWNVANGYLALFSNIAGYANTAVGERALTSNTSGLFNTGIGFRSLLNNEDGFANVAVGTSSLVNNTIGASNVAIGQNTLFSNTVGNFNTAVGYGAGCYAIGGNNVFLGHLAGTSSTLTNRDLSGSVFLGFEAGTDENQSNRLYIENSDSTAPLIYGEFDNDILGFNANVGVGTQTPGSRLHVVEEGTSGVQTIVAGIGSDVSNRPVLQFSETSDIGLNEGMSLEYNGTGAGGANRMVINGLGGNPLIQFRNDGNLNVLDGRIGVQTAFPTCALEINHPIGIANEGLKLTNQVDADAWRFYVQWNTNLLSLLYNNINVGNFDNVSGVYTAISDRNLKTNISNLPSVIEKIQTLQVVDYNFKFQNDSKKYVGLIAQDVELVFPHLVNPPNEESENYTMDYSGFGVLAIKAIQEQQKEITSLKNLLQSQQVEINEIKEILRAHKK